MKAFENPADPGNQPGYHTGQPCIQQGCNQPAGTAWSPLWCFTHNVERMKRVSRGFEKINDLWDAESR